MKNLFNIANLKTIDGELKINTKRYSLYSIIITILVLGSFYGVLVARFRLSEQHFFPAMVVMLGILFLTVWLQYRFTKKLLNSDDGELVTTETLITIRKKFYYKWYEFLIPLLLYQLVPLSQLILFSCVIVAIRLVFEYQRL